MKIILAILCGLMVLFAGGCALTLVGMGASYGDFSAMPLVLIPAAIAALNVLALVAIFSTSRGQTWPLYTLAVLDGLVVVAVLFPTLAYAMNYGSEGMFGLVTAGAFFVKGALSVLYARELRKPPEA